MFKIKKTKLTGMFNPVKKIAKKVKDKVIDTTSDLLSAPSRYKSNKKMAESNRVYDAIKLTKNSEGKPDGGDYKDPLFRARATASAAGYKGGKKIKAEDDMPKGFSGDIKRNSKGNLMAYPLATKSKKKK